MAESKEVLQAQLDLINAKIDFVNAEAAVVAAQAALKVAEGKVDVSPAEALQAIKVDLETKIEIANKVSPSPAQPAQPV